MKLTGPQIKTFVLCTVLTVFLGWIDFVTGYEFGIFAFYSLPVGLASYRIGLRSGLVMAFATTAAWLYTDSLLGHGYSSAFMFCWNSLLRCGCFVINAVSMVKIREHVEARRVLEQELAAAREEAERLRRALAAARQGERAASEVNLSA